MPQVVDIPLSWANNIPGVSGVEDVRFEVPTLGEIDQIIKDATLTVDDVQTALEGQLVEAFEDATVVDELADALIDPLADELAGALPEEVTIDIEGGLFDIEQDLVDLLSEAVENALEELGLLDELQAIVEEALSVVAGEAFDLDVPTVQEIVDGVTDAIEGLLDDFFPGWVTMALGDLIDEVGRRLERRLVSTEASQALADVIEEVT